MLAFLENLNGLELLFACCAVFGAVLFIIRLILMFVGHAGIPIQAGIWMRALCMNRRGRY